MRILLVEDEAGMVDALTAALRRHGIALDHAGTLAAARSLADSGQHDAVLLDRRLPDGDGLELLVRLRARQEGVPVIVMTAGRAGRQGRRPERGRGRLSGQALRVR